MEKEPTKFTFTFYVLEDVVIPMEIQQRMVSAARLEYFRWLTKTQEEYLADPITT